MAFPIKGSNPKFDPAPPGLHEAVLVDIIDLGEVEEEYQGEKSIKHKMKLVWQLKSRNQKTGERFQVRATYTQSLGDSSNFRKMLISWRGRDFKPEELAKFKADIEVLIGKNCQLNVTHAISRSTGNEYAKVSAVLPPVKGADLKPENYTREIPKPAEPVYDVDPIDEGHAAAFDTDDVPFSFLLPLLLTAGAVLGQNLLV